MYLVDSSVLLDLILKDPVWLAWSAEQLNLALAGDRMVLINPIVFAEIASSFASEEALESWMNENFLERAPLPYAAAWAAARAFAAYRKAGGTRSSLLPDFFIGAHAEAEGVTLITRDPKRIRTYFPTVQMIAPE